MKLEIGKSFSRREISDVLGGGTIPYLPTVQGVVVCGCFKREPRWNPDAPEKIVFGPGPRVLATAEIVAVQGGPIPVFIYQSPAVWEYVGEYRCTGLETDPKICREEEEANSAREEICGVLQFRKVAI